MSSGPEHIAAILARLPCLNDTVALLHTHTYIDRRHPTERMQMRHETSDTEQQDAVVCPHCAGRQYTPWREEDVGKMTLMDCVFCRQPFAMWLEWNEMFSTCTIDEPGDAD